MASSTNQPSTFPTTLSELVLRIHLRDGRIHTFLDAPQSSRRYYMGAFLSREFQDRRAEDIRAHHLDFSLFCEVVGYDFDINFPGDDLLLGFIYEHPQLQQDPKFIIIHDAVTFQNCISVLWNSSKISTSASPASHIADLHVFNPKLEGGSVIPPLNEYLEMMRSPVPDNPPGGSGPVRPTSLLLPGQNDANTLPDLPQEVPSHEDSPPPSPTPSLSARSLDEADLIGDLTLDPVRTLHNIDDGDLFDDVNNIPSMMHFTKESWLEMCEFFCDHDPTHVYYLDGQYVRCPGLKRHARPYQAYIVWWLFKGKTEGIHGAILAEGIGLGKTYETYLFCWVQNVIIAAGQDMLRSRDALATPELRGRHLAAGTDKNPQPDDARCPSQSSWGVQCPCVERSLSSKLFEIINVGPVLIVVPPKLIPHWRDEFEKTFDTEHPKPEALQVRFFIEHHEHLKSSFENLTSGDEKTRKQFYYHGDKNCCTRFIFLTCSNRSITSKIDNVQRFKSKITGRSVFSAFFWDEFHESRNPASLHSLFFFRQMSQKSAYSTCPSLYGLSGTPIIKTIKDVSCIIKTIQSKEWLQTDHPRYASCIANIEILAKRYNDLLKEGDLLREHAQGENRELNDAERESEKKVRELYSTDLNEALLPVMAVRRAADLWFGRPIVPLPPMTQSFIMVDTEEEYIPFIKTLADKAKARADFAWERLLEKWTRDGKKAPQPVRDDSRLKGDAVFTQVRFCASFPAYAKVFHSATEAGETVSLLASYIRDQSLYITKSKKKIDSSWYGKYFEQLIEGSQKLEELSKFLDEMKSRSAGSSRNEKMIIGCSGPPVVALLRLWFLLKRPDMPMVILHPEISNKDRGALVRSFSARADEDENYENQEAYEAVVLISNMKLLATGYNIQEANNICIFDLPWTPDQWDQTVGRGYRSGQDRDVHVKTLVALGNGIEARIYYAFQVHKEVTDFSFNITNGESEKKEAERLRRRLAKQARERLEVLERERVEREERERLEKEHEDTEMGDAWQLAKQARERLEGLERERVEREERERLEKELEDTEMGDA